jgi:hypothetical protein
MQKAINPTREPIPAIIATAITASKFLETN